MPLKYIMGVCVCSSKEYMLKWICMCHGRWVVANFVAYRVLELTPFVFNSEWAVSALALYLVIHSCFLSLMLTLLSPKGLLCCLSKLIIKIFSTCNMPKITEEALTCELTTSHSTVVAALWPFYRKYTAPLVLLYRPFISVCPICYLLVCIGG